MTRKRPQNKIKKPEIAPEAMPPAARPESERIAKVMARAGLCSRREAETWILAGRVAVNGAKISSPALNVKPSDAIVVDGKPMPVAERTRLFLYHKPRGLVTSNVDPEGRPTIFAALPKTLPRLVSVGRLDMNTEGLLLLTNDGGLARILELPQTGWLRRYRVRALGKITQADLNPLRKGITIDKIQYGSIEANVDREQGANVWLTFAIREGKNREVRNVLEHLGLQVNRLIRVSFGPFQLGDLAAGGVEEIRTRHLREQLGERIAQQSGADFAGPIAVIAPPREEKNEDAAPKRPNRENTERASAKHGRHSSREDDKRENTRGGHRNRGNNASATAKEDRRENPKNKMTSNRPDPRHKPKHKGRKKQPVLHARGRAQRKKR